MDEKIFGKGIFAKPISTPYGEMLVLNFNDDFIEFFQNNKTDGRMGLYLKKSQNGKLYTELAIPDPNYSATANLVTYNKDRKPETKNEPTAPPQTDEVPFPDIPNDSQKEDDLPF